MEIDRSERFAHYEAAIEAILLAASEPLPAQALAAALRRAGAVGVEASDVAACVEALRAHYAARGAGLAVEQWAGGYRLTTHPDYAPYVEAAEVEEKVLKLSGALLETLAVIAYKQPASKPEVDFVRGVDSGYAISRLGEHGLVAVVGRSEGVGKPMLYGTTPAFLETFGLASLDALPGLREMEELLSDPAFSREKARLLTLQAFRSDADAPPSPSDDEAPETSA